MKHTHKNTRSLLNNPLGGRFKFVNFLLPSLGFFSLCLALLSFGFSWNLCWLKFWREICALSAALRQVVRWTLVQQNPRGNDVWRYISRKLRGLILCLIFHPHFNSLTSLLPRVEFVLARIQRWYGWNFYMSVKWLLRYCTKQLFWNW